MSKRLQKHAETLRYLAKCDRHSAKSIIKSAQPQLVDCISEICYNVLQGNVKLSPLEKQKLRKYKNQIRKVANKKTTRKTKRVLIQKGGFLGAILAPLLGTVIGPLAKSIFGGK